MILGKEVQIYKSYRSPKKIKNTNDIRLVHVFKSKSKTVIYEINKIVCFTFFLLLGITSSDKSDDTNGAVANFQSLDGENCELILALALDDEFRTLAPTNITDFDITPSESLEVIIEFQELSNGLSNCEFSEPISLISISGK